MKIKLHINRLNHTNETSKLVRPQRGKARSTAGLLAVTAASALLTAQSVRADDDWGKNKHTVDVGNIFVIAMENHNFTQPGTQTSPRQIFGNPAAPYLNSLITPGNPNAAQVSFATAYYNAGMNVHPSEPSYVWAEAGSDFGVHTDADPKPGSGNTFYDQANHFTAQLNVAGIPWNNYQEDVQLISSPTDSASGTSATVINPFYGTGQYNYAAKHNPMAFFAATALQNVYPLSRLFTDMNDNMVGRYNWITPNQYNDAHSALMGGFTYNGTLYTGDQASVAQGDNFLSQVIPQIMASKTYKNNGVIVIWWDESEGGDGTNRTIPEIIISPLAKGNAYAGAVAMSHSSDIKTWEEIFGLPALNNSIPVNETNNFGGYNNVATANDLSDLFVPGVIPSPSVTVTPSKFVLDPHTHHYFETVDVANTSNAPVPAPLWLVLDNLGSSVALLNADGTTAVLPPLFSPYINVPVGDDGVLRPHEHKNVRLEFLDPSGQPINYQASVLSVTPTP